MTTKTMLMEKPPKKTKGYPILPELNTSSSIHIAPISVKDGNLNINDRQLNINEIHEFKYLDANMVLWKSPNGSINIYQVLTE